MFIDVAAFRLKERSFTFRSSVSWQYSAIKLIKSNVQTEMAIGVAIKI